MRQLGAHLLYAAVEELPALVSTLNAQHSTLITQHSTLSTQHSTLNTQPSTLNPQPSQKALRDARLAAIGDVRAWADTWTRAVYFFFFFITFGLEYSDRTSLRSLNTSPPRNCFSLQQSYFAWIECCT